MGVDHLQTFCPMEFFPLNTVAGVTLFLLFLSLALAKLWSGTSPRKPRTCQAPEPRERWPLIGHLQLLLPPPAAAAGTLSQLADKYGPAITLRLGFQRTLVVSSMELAKECFTTNDRAFAGRPLDSAGYHLGYGYLMPGLAPYGPYWRHMRKMTTVNLLSPHHMGLLRHIQADEVARLVQELRGAWARNGSQPVKVDMRQRLSDLASNIIGLVVIGQRYAESGGLRRLLREWTSFFGGMSLSDAFPLFGWLGLDMRVRAMKRVSSQLDGVIEGWLSEHRRKKRDSTSKDEDFMDTLISAMSEAQDADSTIKATVLALITGGSDTVSVSLTWALYLLLNHRGALQKVQDELDVHVGRDGNVGESSLKNLIYLDAVINEALRLHPTFPLLVPHQALDDCHVGGFFVPAGTRLLVNVWKIQQDGMIWTDPTQFKPERFLDRTVDPAAGKSFELIPFGSGRRICPGSNFAMSGMKLALAWLVRSFELELHPDSPLGDPVADGFDVLLSPRLPPS